MPWHRRCRKYRLLNSDPFIGDERPRVGIGHQFVGRMALEYTAYSGQYLIARKQPPIEQEIDALILKQCLDLISCHLLFLITNESSR